VSDLAHGARPEALVLVVDDDVAVRQGLVDVCATVGIRAVGVSCAAEAHQVQSSARPAVVVSDFRLPDASGMELAGALKLADPDVSVILLTGYASIESAVEAVGLLDAYLIKPVPPQTFIHAVRHALARRALVDENRNLVERLERLNAYQALYDPLTGLPNRALLDDRLNQALAACRRTGSSVAVLFVDLDGFKVVNDLFGHHVGDELLCHMADRLGDARRQSDTVARFGGDEFVVVCPDIKTSAAACRIADHLLDQLAMPVEIGGVEHRLTASVGIAVTSPGAADESAETLLRNADTAMYRAKDEGRAGWELFDASMRDRVMERFEIERGLRAAMESSDLAVVYQPMVALETGALAGAEALLRWHRAGHGTVLPGTFLGVAEESGLIVSVGRWVLDRVLGDLAAWRAADLVPESFRLWVNLSPHQLANLRFADLVGELMERYDIPGETLGFEVVEDALRDVGATVVVLRDLRARGLSISLDDFGAGHSNLSWLQDLPITGIKIDRQFVSTLDGVGAPRTTAIVRGLISLGHSLGLSVVGEGVETKAQGDALRSMGCELAQGYFYGYPGSAGELWSRATLSRSVSPAPDGVALERQAPSVGG
jgi:diguanylate cyclase (GGDEF)-like protein